LYPLTLPGQPKQHVRGFTLRRRAATAAVSHSMDGKSFLGAKGSASSLAFMKGSLALRRTRKGLDGVLLPDAERSYECVGLSFHCQTCIRLRKSLASNFASNRAYSCPSLPTSATRKALKPLDFGQRMANCWFKVQILVGPPRGILLRAFTQLPWWNLRGPAIDLRDRDP
jgi:hypothetical protein